MKVCFVAGTLGRGGAERQLLFMLRALRDEGIDSKLLCLTSGEAFEAEVRELGIDVEWVGSSSNRIVRLIRIIQAVRAYGADIVQSAHFYTNLYVAVAGRVLNTPDIGAIRNDLSSELGADSVFGKWQFRLPRWLIANSEQARGKAVAMDQKGRTIEVVRNVVELPAEPAERSAVEGSATRILFVGRLVRQKRPEVFIELARRLVDGLRDFDLSFDIVGEGPLRAELEKLRDDSGAAGAKIRFLGEQAEMSGIYRQSDILVLTSGFEGTPNVVLEAMAHGMPVVATRVGGVPEILSDESGIVVDPSDFDGLFGGIKRLIQDRPRRITMGKNGQSHVSGHHSLRYLRRRLPEIYRQMSLIRTDD